MGAARSSLLRSEAMPARHVAFLLSIISALLLVQAEDAAASHATLLANNQHAPYGRDKHLASQLHDMLDSIDDMLTTAKGVAKGTKDPKVKSFAENKLMELEDQRANVKAEEEELAAVVKLKAKIAAKDCRAQKKDKAATQRLDKESHKVEHEVEQKMKQADVHAHPVAELDEESSMGAPKPAPKPAAKALKAAPKPKPAKKIAAKPKPAKKTAAKPKPASSVHHLTKNQKNSKIAKKAKKAAHKMKKALKAHERQAKAQLPKTRKSAKAYKAAHSAENGAWGYASLGVKAARALHEEAVNMEVMQKAKLKKKEKKMKAEKRMTKIKVKALVRAAKAGMPNGIKAAEKRVKHLQQKRMALHRKLVKAKKGYAAAEKKTFSGKHHHHLPEEKQHKAAIKHVMINAKANLASVNKHKITKKNKGTRWKKNMKVAKMLSAKHKTDVKQEMWLLQWIRNFY